MYDTRHDYVTVDGTEYQVLPDTGEIVAEVCHYRNGNVDVVFPEWVVEEMAQDDLPRLGNRRTKRAFWHSNAR